MNNHVSQNCTHIGVGIDTARYAHHASFLDEEKRSAAKPFHFTENAEGYQQLRDTLYKLAAKHVNPHLHIHIDAAGQYAENLLQWLHRLDLNIAGLIITISVGQPARNKAYRKVHFDKRKADPAESMACARFAIVERPPATPHNPPEFQQLRDVVALLESAAKHHTRLVNQLHNLLARVFPELATIVNDIAAGWVLTLLERYPTPAKLARAKAGTIAAIPHLPAALVPKLQEAAAHSLGSQQGMLVEELVRQKVRAIRMQDEETHNLQKLLEKAWKSLPDAPYRRLITIKGIGVQTAAALVAKIVSIDRFSTASALIGYFGVFPEEVDVSGTDRQGKPKAGKEIHMSRKGNDLVRRLLYTAAQSAVKWNPAVRALFARLMARPMADNTKYNIAIGHCMAKLLRQVFGLWKKDCDFDPEIETRSEAEPTIKAEVAETQATEETKTEETKKVVGHKDASNPPRKVVTTTTSNIPSSARPSKRPPLNFGLLRQQISIARVLEMISWHAQSARGPQWRGACPLHEAQGTHSRSFAVHTEKNAYCCHRCGSQGNALDLWTSLSDKPLLEAAWDLVETLKLTPPLLNEGTPGANH